MKGTGFHLGYCPALDGMRAFAVMSVFAFHAGAFEGGFWGVDVFFVLSGFLITVLLLEEHERAGTIQLKWFYARRALRLLPALVVLLIAYIAFNVALHTGEAIWGPPLAVLLYVANWTRVLGLVNLGSLTHTWSLAIEGQFYLLWPPVLASMLAFRVRRVWCLGLTVLAIDAVAADRLVLWARGASFVRIYNGFDTRLDTLLVGCLLAMVVTWHLERVRTWRPVLGPLALLATAVVVLTAATSEYRSILPYQGTSMMLAVCVAMVIAALVVGVNVPFLTWAPVVWLGRVSYGFYLWHHFVLGNLAPRLHLPYVPTVAVCLAVTLAVTALSFYGVERPLLRLKTRLRP